MGGPCFSLVAYVSTAREGGRGEYTVFLVDLDKESISSFLLTTRGEGSLNIFYPFAYPDTFSSLPSSLYVQRRNSCPLSFFLSFLLCLALAFCYGVWCGNGHDIVEGGLLYFKVASPKRPLFRAKGSFWLDSW